MFVLRHKTPFLIIAGLAVAAALSATAVWGLNPGIEFTGGSLVEISFPDGRPSAAVLEERASSVIEGDVLVQTSGRDAAIIRTPMLDAGAYAELISALSGDGSPRVQEDRLSTFGPSIGSELARKAWVAIGLVLAGIVAYVAFVFRKHGEDEDRAALPLRGWHYGNAAVIALAHDIILPTGLFAVLGAYFIDAQIDALFVTALLAILGYSVNDTIVVFDRIRENLLEDRKNGATDVPVEDSIGRGLRQTVARSVNTSLTTLCVLAALFFIGTAEMQSFALVLAAGVIAGTYSSLFLAAPLLSLWAARR